MAHHLDTPIGSEFSYECLQLRARRRELGSPEPDASFRNRYPVTQRIERHGVASDRVVGISEAEWDERQRQARLG